MTNPQPNLQPLILRRRQVEQLTSLSRSTIYARLTLNPKRPQDFDPSFPRPVRMGPKSVGWIATEIDAWVSKRVAARDGARATGGGE